jgi:hypothetical protein
MAAPRTFACRRERSPVVVARDPRFLTRFAAFGLATLAVGFGSCFAIAAGWVPGPLQGPAFFACILVGLTGVAGALAPLVLGMPCRDCGTRIFVAPSRHPENRRPAIRFYCPTCDVDWDTGLWWGEE